MVVEQKFHNLTYLSQSYSKCSECGLTLSNSISRFSPCETVTLKTGSKESLSHYLTRKTIDFISVGYIVSYEDVAEQLFRINAGKRLFPQELNVIGLFLLNDLVELA